MIIIFSWNPAFHVWLLKELIPASIIQWGSGPLWTLLDLQCRILTKFIPIVVAFESPLLLFLLSFIFMACLCLCLPIVYILIFVLQSWSYTYAAIFFHRRNNGSMPCFLKPAESFSKARRAIQIAAKQRGIIIMRRNKESLFILISCI